MLRYAHFYMKGGKPSFAASAKSIDDPLINNLASMQASYFPVGLAGKDHELHD
jgi:hypothetical protein